VKQRDDSASSRTDVSKLAIITGLKTLSSKWPWQPPNVMAPWLPTTCAQRETRLASHVASRPARPSVRMRSGVAFARRVPHLRTDHRQRLALRRVDLAWHDGRAGLVLGQRELAEARSRPRAQEADVCGRTVDGRHTHSRRSAKRDADVYQTRRDAEARYDAMRHDSARIRRRGLPVRRVQRPHRWRFY
jgi:hypothetical protein